jgi:two-component system sensor histidine kinase TctE
MFRSLRAGLLVWLLVPLLLLALFNAWTTRLRAVETASLFIDRMLLASARVMAEQVKERDGAIEALIPPSALEMFASPDRDRVIYRITSPTGELLAGYPDVAVPPQPLVDFQPVYFDAMFRTEAIRAVAIAQPVVSATLGGNAIVIIAETLRQRDRLATQLWVPVLRDQLLIVAIAAVLLLLGLRRGLAPLLRIRTAIVMRDQTSLEELPLAEVQSELRPLIEAFNQALARVANYITSQRRFVSNASHQLRTPLAILKVQAAAGKRDRSIAAKDEALDAIDSGLDRMTRLVNQLLTLARAEAHGVALRKELLDFVATARNASARLAPLALEAGIELAFYAEGEMPILGHAGLLQEMIANLVENAILYSPKGGSVSVSLKRTDALIRLIVEDNGPGIPPEEHARVFERFYRSPGTHVEGTGLGLSLVREIVAAHGGRIVLGDRAPLSGLAFEITLPLGARTPLTGSIGVVQGRRPPLSHAAFDVGHQIIGDQRDDHDDDNCGIHAGRVERALGDIDQKTDAVPRANEFTDDRAHNRKAKAHVKGSEDPAHGGRHDDKAR